MNLKTLGIGLTFILCLLLSGVAAAATIQITGAGITTPGETATIPVTLDETPAGLAGYKMTITLTTPGVARITEVSFPEWASLKNVDATLPAEIVVITAVDLMDTMKTGATNLPLCDLTIEGVASGTTDVAITVTELTDDSGNPIQFTIIPASVMVGSSGSSPAATPTPSPAPTQSSVTPVPTDGVTPEPTAVPTPVPTEATPVEPTVTQTIQPTPTETVGPLATPTPVPTVVADFTADVTSGPSPMTVSFTDLSSGYPDTFLWNFGDNSSDSTSVVQNPQHTYRIPGIYSVTLNASNSENSNQTSRHNYIVAAQMRMPQKGEKTAMQIFSVPEGADCYLNNVYQGITPVNITNLTPRTYQLRLHKDGYYDVVSPVIANKGVLPTFVSGYEMVPHYAEIGKLVADPPQTGAAYIVTYPELVTAYIDGKKVGKTDIMVMNLAVGTRNLTLVRDGFANWTDTIDIRNGLAVIQTYTYEQPYFPPEKTTEYVDLSS